MTDQATQMICPRCGVPMNHHGEKLVEPRNAEEASRMKPSLDGLIEEIHACPKCGGVGSRPGA
jgi:ribosomal protein S27AE